MKFVLNERDKADNTNLRGRITVRITPFYVVWIQLLCLCRLNSSFTCLVKFKPVKQEVSCTVILPPMVRGGIDSSFSVETVLRVFYIKPSNELEQ